ncbi:MAG: hypothetical protein M3Q34_04575 [bacterium]|nr:hypothetical protein [bacterium]
MKKYLTKNNLIQFFLVVFTILGFLFTSLKMPAYGLVFNMISQIFWLQASYKAWKDANQIGIFINTVIITIILMFGIVNYWFL